MGCYPTVNRETKPASQRPFLAERLCAAKSVRAESSTGGLLALGGRLSYRFCGETFGFTQ